MKKREFFNYLSEKYNLPYEYIEFKLKNIYLYKSVVNVPFDVLEIIENSIYWDCMISDYEFDKNNKNSIFYKEN